MFKRARLFPLFAIVAFWLSILSGVIAAAGQSVVTPRADYADVAAIMKPFIERQMAEKQLQALSIAVVDDQTITWASGFGLADRTTKTPATADTVYRIGSVSKLFTDIGVMQLVERGELRLDNPITNYLPGFQP